MYMTSIICICIHIIYSVGICIDLTGPTAEVNLKRSDHFRIIPIYPARRYIYYYHTTNRIPRSW